MTSRYLEIACFSLESAIIAYEAGAQRIELCTNHKLGGTTPSLQDFKELRDKIDTIPIHVMIRPRGGNFEYTDQEFEIMKHEIQQFRTSGADGFVFGILKLDENHQVIDVKRCRELVDLADGCFCTFHRAFDELEHAEAGLKHVMACRFKAILTSGGRHDATDGINKLKSLVRLADAKVDVVVGGGVRSSNIENLAIQTDAYWFHSSAIVDETSTASVDEVAGLLNGLSNINYI